PDVAETCSGSSEECPPDALAPAGTPCDTDDDPCTVDRCDGGGACRFAENSTAETCGFCGDLVTEPCTVTVDSRRGTFGSLQKAVDAAPDGATLTVRGACSGPVKIVDREDLTLQGVPPPAGCPADGPQPRDLLSTLRGSRGGRP